MEPSDPLLAQARRYGYAEADGVWLRPVLGQPARRLGDVRDSEPAALLYFAQRYEAFRRKVEEVLDRVATSENQGSHLMKALHLKELTLTYDGLGDFETLHRRLTTAEADLKTGIARNRAKNLALKIDLIRQAEVASQSLDWVSAGETVKELRRTWLQVGPTDKEVSEELETRFQAAIQTFFDRRKAFQADKKAMANRAQSRYRELLQQAEKLKHSTNFETASRQLKQLQADWREVRGTVNKKTAAELWTQFRAANNFFFERLKVHIESQRVSVSGPEAADDDPLAQKRRLAERIEALMQAPPQEAVPQAKLLQAAWKQVGTVRGEESDRLWQRFMVACDRIFEQSALEYAVRKQLEGAPETGGPATRASIRLGLLREMLRADQTELATLQTNFDNLGPAPANDAFRQMLQTKIRSLERKVRTKNDLIVLFGQQAQAAS